MDCLLRAFFSGLKNYKLFHYRKSRNIRGTGFDIIIVIIGLFSKNGKSGS